MSLRRKMLFKDFALFVSLLLMIAGSLWGLLMQRQHVRASLNECSALQRVQLAQSHLVAFQQRLHAGDMRTPQAVAELQAASVTMREYKAIVTQYNSILPKEITPSMQATVKDKTRQLVTELVQLAAQIDPPRLKRVSDPIDPQTASVAVDQLLRETADLLNLCNDFVHRTQIESDRDLHVAIIGVSAVAGVTLFTAMLASLWQYRRIMSPLKHLRTWCRRIAEGDFSAAYQPDGDREFAELARDVNQMAAELEAFSKKMESMVASKSRELVRSERLASAGYLAAGVAHEINNPLNIMSGYAELTIKRLRRSSPSEIDEQVIQHLSIIRGEAFRCKEITRKLLSLAKGNGDVRETISLADAVQEVVTLVRGLKSFRSRQLQVSIPVGEPLPVLANLTEIKQVLLNLVVNAIEAVSDRGGKISIEGRRTNDRIELVVSDNGRGMSGETLERIFEPFFTNKRGAGEPGTGLGLSITHAIITHHGGEIIAGSDGLNRGSRFVMRMPTAAMGRIAASAIPQIPAVNA
jgi:signal transduction histidine kinase